MSFELDHRGAEEVLKRIAAGEINALARKVGSHAGDDAIVAEYTTDRAAASISVPAEQQAKDGVLTRAAAAAGLEIHLR
ncbi:hypothetical protein [Mycobacterium aquaticum]|uniref:Uncharacterized protein n=1 Tax=Mycobacterium aquaticum TaxID=1927124 RepID=A0A1X0A0D4_9MYCO|nr:hypothetical protein [Mycobacterium aquaticum]ORA23402.1 hypothetical protein BST13_35200 [Mycobacterium aquaticum]